jgi:hypothetical protein
MSASPNKPDTTLPRSFNWIATIIALLTVAVIIFCMRYAKKTNLDPDVERAVKVITQYFDNSGPQKQWQAELDSQGAIGTSYSQDKEIATNLVIAICTGDLAKQKTMLNSMTVGELRRVAILLRYALEKSNSGYAFWVIYPNVESNRGYTIYLDPVEDKSYSLHVIADGTSQIPRASVSKAKAIQMDNGQIALDWKMVPESEFSPEDLAQSIGKNIVDKFKPKQNQNN